MSQTEENSLKYSDLKIDEILANFFVKKRVSESEKEDNYKGIDDSDCKLNKKKSKEKQKKKKKKHKKQKSTHKRHHKSSFVESEEKTKRHRYNSESSSKSSDSDSTKTSATYKSKTFSTANDKKYSSYQKYHHKKSSYYKSASKHGRHSDSSSHSLSHKKKRERHAKSSDSDSYYSSRNKKSKNSRSWSHSDNSDVNISVERHSESKVKEEHRRTSVSSCNSNTSIKKHIHSPECDKTFETCLQQSNNENDLCVKAVKTDAHDGTENENIVTDVVPECNSDELRNIPINHDSVDSLTVLQTNNISVSKSIEITSKKFVDVCNVEHSDLEKYYLNKQSIVSTQITSSFQCSVNDDSEKVSKHKSSSSDQINSLKKKVKKKKVKKHLKNKKLSKSSKIMDNPKITEVKEDLYTCAEPNSTKSEVNENKDFKDKASDVQKQAVLEKFLKHEEDYKLSSFSSHSLKKKSNLVERSSRKSYFDSKEESRLHDRHRRQRSRSYDSDEKSYRHDVRKRSRSREYYSRRERSPESDTESRRYSNNYKRKKSHERSKRRSTERKYYHDRSLSPAKHGTNEKFDKAKLFEVARKNVMTMIEKGTLPEGLNIEIIKQEQLIPLKAGGKSVAELTDFCRALSKNENLDENSNDVHSELAGQPFVHHPFKLKEQSVITLNIKNAVQIPIKSHAEKVQENARTLSLQFPVSSGNQHRQKEMEWVPVEKSMKSEHSVSQVTQTKTEIKQEVLPVSTPEITQTSPNNSVVALLPTPSVPPVKHLPPSSQPTVIQPVYNVVPAVSHSLCRALVPSSQGSSSHTNFYSPPAACVSMSKKDLDISSIVADRLKAQRKLQENPNDANALNELRLTELKLQNWVHSKMVPGQFTGSTNVKVLSAEELSGPRQAWVKRDIFTRAAPVTEGKGMSLLKKMGWNPGEGLGKNKEGSLEPLVLDIKTDKRGLVSEGEGGRKTNLKPDANAPVSDMHKKHPVSILMELCSKRKWEPPLYTVVHESGPSHKKVFLFKVLVNNVEYQPSTSIPNKKQAKAQAAILCLQSLGVLPKDYKTPTT